MHDVALAGAAGQASSGIDWTGVWTAVGAIATALAVIISLGLLLRDRARYLRAEEERQKEQASHVWVQEAFGKGAALQEVVADTVTRYIPVAYGNTSADVIIDAVLTVRVEPASAVVAVRPPDPGAGPLTMRLFKLAPGQTGEQTFVVHIALRPDGSGEPVDHKIGTTLHFIDSAGRFWVRDEAGFLERLKAYPFDLIR